MTYSDPRTDPSAYKDTRKVVDDEVPGTLPRVLMGIDLVSGSSGDGPAQYAPKDGTPNVVTSLTKDGWHAPVLDLDIPCEYVPSSTPGHGHLYIDRQMTLPQYVKLMEVLVEVGIVEKGFLYSLEQRGFTCVRLPWVTKPEPKDW
jgi:hypothetical protein